MNESDSMVQACRIVRYGNNFECYLVQCVEFYETEKMRYIFWYKPTEMYAEGMKIIFDGYFYIRDYGRNVRAPVQ